MMPNAPIRALPLGPSSFTCESRADGSVVLRSTQPLAEYPARVTDRLRHWAEVAPERTFLAQRDSTGAWRRLSYAQVLHSVQRIAAALLQRGLSAERPVAILSDNDLENALLGLAAQHVGIAFAPISPAYSLVQGELTKLRYVLDLLTPGLVFAADGQRYARALREVVPVGTEIVVTHNASPDLQVTLFESLLQEGNDLAVQAAHEVVGPDTIAKFLFSSGSTGMPKGVINTHRMLCSNQQMGLQALPSLADPPPVIVDWLPWNHTFGGNHNLGFALYNGGTLYIDDGKPVPGLFERSVANLRDIAPTVYLNVPKGFETLVHALKADAALAKHFFSRLQFMFYAGAGLSQHIWDSLDQLASDAVGERIAMITGLGCTETAPSATFANFIGGRSGGIGTPVAGIEFKMVPIGSKFEARVRGASVTPGYWRAPQLTAKAFDAEGYFCTGDAVKFIDTNDPSRGLLFDGRITEDFKLSSGTWVSAGPLRSKFVLHCAPLIRDVVLTGLNRDELGALVFPDIAACRHLCSDFAAAAPLQQVLSHPLLLERLQQHLDTLANTATGSATRITRAYLMIEIPTVDTGEATDKGSLNCAAVLQRRADLVEQLYSDDSGTNPLQLRATQAVPSPSKVSKDP